MLSATAYCLLGCSEPEADAPVNRAASAAPSPAPTPSTPPTAAPVAVTAAPPPAPAVAVVAAPVAPAGSPRKSVTGDGISITETSDGQVILKTTALWGEAIDTTYTDCGYYNAAISVIKNQVSAERGRLLTRVCAKAATKPQR